VAPTPTLVVRDWTTWTPVVTVTAALNPRTMVLVTVTDWLKKNPMLTVRDSLAVHCPTTLAGVGFWTNRPYATSNAGVAERTMKRVPSSV
jgi:hypothetical protein